MDEEFCERIGRGIYQPPEVKIQNDCEFKESPRPNLGEKVTQELKLHGVCHQS